MSMDNPRYNNLNMTVENCVVAFSEGNIGALSAIMEMVKAQPTTDPRSALGPFGIFTHLDIADIYGPGIWILYKYACKESARNTIGVLRAMQLGFIDGSVLKAEVEAFRRQGGRKLNIPVRELLEKVKDQIPQCVFDEIPLAPVGE